MVSVQVSEETLQNLQQLLRDLLEARHALKKRDDKELKKMVKKETSLRASIKKAQESLMTEITGIQMKEEEETNNKKESEKPESGEHVPPPKKKSKTGATKKQQSTSGDTEQDSELMAAARRQWDQPMPVDD